MCSDKRDETSSSPKPSKESEQNPFVAFRHHVDQQINSLLGSVFSIPSTIYNQGAQHGREWSERRCHKSREDSGSNKTAGPTDMGKEWEEAMKDFEDSEREAREWYDTVLKQITARRDAHLESGLGFSDKDTKRVDTGAEPPKDEMSCPYLPPKEQRVITAVEEPKDKSRKWCRREYPHSRYFDWVWSGWGGPSTTPNMLWHQERREQKQPFQKMAEEAVKAEDTKPVTEVSVLPIYEVENDSQDDAFPSTDNPISLATWFFFNRYSPFQLEDHPELGARGPAWRTAYEDLLRAQIDEPLTTDEESTDAQFASTALWMARVAELHSMNVMTKERRERYKLLREQVPSFLDSMAEEMKMVEALTKPQSWDELVKSVFGDVQEPPTETELDAYEEYFTRSEAEADTPPVSKQLSAPTGNDEIPKPSILGTLTRTERIINADGTITERTVLKESFANGRERTTETMKTTDKDGTTKSETSSTKDAQQSHSQQPQGFLPWQGSMEVFDLDRDIQAPEYTRQDQNGAAHDARRYTKPNEQTAQKERANEKKSGGWFWRN
ncbi:hypothetical protein NA57DRAFT_78833 [Rhizodiscina lignyota]|uniref:Uncharacterized protein n=1 Tax=Rhizodiscina lignyota TaxID=1504668 RepID=A0A9P4ID64_9PEZI|nr:hypothetical protein NA57DRAFT_78833 [Rhizodiscina lignyota]